MKTLFNENWFFCELPIDYKLCYKNDEKVLLEPEQFYEEAQKLSYKPVAVPHDWQIWHTKDLYKNSTGCYKKSFGLSQAQISDGYVALLFGGVYMNCAVWINGKLAGKWKYGYSQFEVDITDFVQEGSNEVQVLAVYQNCNTRWYSGAGIFRDVELITSRRIHLVTDGVYFSAKKAQAGAAENAADFNEADAKDGFEKGGTWDCRISAEVAGLEENAAVETKPVIKISILDKDDGSILAQKILSGPDFSAKFTIENPKVWDITSPEFYILKTELLDQNNEILDCITQHCGFKTALFTSDKGFFLNGRHVKIYGACQHHDLGAFGSAFNKNALRRQFLKLKKMGVNAVRCSHNPPPHAWMELCDELGLLVDDECFDMWEKCKTPFDYGNYFNEWYARDVASWVRKDRNYPSLIMWSIGNEIYDTHVGNGFEITQKLYAEVVKHDPNRNAPITIGSNYMMTDGAQNCATKIDTVGYNYLERLYKEHHQNHPEWKIYGSETGSTVQTRGIYHFPESLQLVTFSDGQCSTLGNCSAPWGAKNSQTVINSERDCPFSAGQFIWTGWDYIGEPTPYHTKSSYFGQIDTAGFPKDTFYNYKAEWAYKNTAPFVHLLPYWDWNPGQIIDVKAYSNADAVELFFNEKSLGRQNIDHEHGAEPFGRWRLPYEKGEIKVVAYDSNGGAVAQDAKHSFDDPAQIIMKPESEDYDDLFFIQLMTADKNGYLVENARNYITFNVSGNAELIGMDNGDSTDYDEYKSENGNTHSRKLFANRLIAIVKAKPAKNTKSGKGSFVITAASKDLPTVSMKYDGEKWIEAAPYNSIHAIEDFVPARKIEIITQGSSELSPQNREVKVTCKLYPANASLKEINWNPVLKECVSSNNIQVCDIQTMCSPDATSSQNAAPLQPYTQTATIRAVGDGECILRCTNKNGTKLDEVLSDMNFTVKDVGNPNLDPYVLIEACRATGWDKSKQKPAIGLESGVSTRGTGPNWISFDKVDFGKDGADSIHIPIFTFETSVPVEIWDGEPGEGTTYDGTVPSTTGGKCLGKFTYSHESIYNTYNENVFTLERRLFGIHTISVAFPKELYFHGFYFDKTPKAYAKLCALDADVISGDSFKKTDVAVEGIGNNVNLDFSNMDFSETTKITICGKSNTENNSINVRFFAQDGTVINSVIEFSHTDTYEERTFEITPVKGMQKVSFIFLPGCNFDFKWFQFK